MIKNLKFACILIIASYINISALSQSTSIKGNVKDSGGLSISGANIFVKGTTMGAITDNYGDYILSNLPSGEQNIVCSYIGFTNLEKVITIVSGQTQMLDFVISADVKLLEELVIVGYGTQKKANLTGAVGSVSSENIEKSHAANISNAIVGRIPGIIAKQSNGEPGKDGSQIYIRGIATYQGNSNPCVIIDGIERSIQDFSQLNPEEIESVNILKDAAAASIFGMRGANGVIVIKTRRGNIGKPVWSYSYNLGIQSPTKLPEFTNSYNYAKAFNEKVDYSSGVKYTDEELELFKNGTDAYPNTDWYRTIMANKYAIQQQHGFSVNGGTEKVRYFASLGYLDQGGFYDPLNFKRYNLRSNVDIDLTKSTIFSIDFAGRLENTSEASIPSNGVFAETLRNPPIMAAQYSNGLLASPLGGHANTYALINEGAARQSENNKLLTRLSLDQRIDFIKGLSAKFIFSYDKNDYDSESWASSPQTYSFDGTNYNPSKRGDPSLYMEGNTVNYSETQIQLNYSRKFGDHELSGLAMFLQNQNDSRQYTINAWGYANEILRTVDAASENISTGTNSKFGRQSFIARINYAYKSKYLGEANIRKDGTENFAPDYRWGTFSSFSLGWIISEESFMENLTAIDFLKLRGSYGTLGNDQINSDRFPYLSKYNLYTGGKFIGSQINYGDYLFNNQYVKGFAEVMGNKVISWETSTKKNFGIDGKLLKMFDFSVDYFAENRTGILGRRSASVPLSFGATLPMENIGKVSNKGIELSLGINKTINDAHFYLNGNLTYVQNEIVFRDEAKGTSEYLKTEGRPVDAYYGYKAAGIFRTLEEIANAPKQQIAGKTYKTKIGDTWYADINGDSIVNADDRTYLGEGNIPDIIYGISGGFEYKNIDFSFMFQGAAKVQYQLQGQVVWPFYNGGGVPKFWADDHWTEQTPDAHYSSLNVNTHNFPIDVPSSLFIYDASYLRLKNIELGYTIKGSFFEKSGITGLRVHVGAQNLLTFTKVPQVDPENTSNMGQNYPNVKAINFGAKINF
jgi:TonB-linked SusC/RagA family outer membrane protein